MGHASVLEHVTLTYGVEGISRAASHQLVRHRIASYSQQSQRYVAAKFGYVTPPTVAASPDLLAGYERHMAACSRLYAKLMKAGDPAGGRALRPSQRDGNEDPDHDERA